MVPKLALHSCRTSPCFSAWVFLFVCVVRVLRHLGNPAALPLSGAVSILDRSILLPSTFSLRSISSILHVATSDHEHSGCRCTFPKDCSRLHIVLPSVCSTSCTNSSATALSLLSPSLWIFCEEESGLWSGACSVAGVVRQSSRQREQSNHVDVDATNDGQLPAVFVDASSVWV